MVYLGLGVKVRKTGVKDEKVACLMVGKHSMRCGKGLRGGRE